MMHVATVYLLITLAAFLAVCMASSKGRRAPRLGPLNFIIALPIAEWPLHHLALSAVVTGVFVAAGALDHWQGLAGACLLLASWVLLVRLFVRAGPARQAIERALAESLGPAYRQAIGADHGRGLRDGAPLARWANPFAIHDKEAVERIADLQYGPAGVRNLLDVYRPRQATTAAPVLLQIHGGAWVFGNKAEQGRPLMNEMARQGWVCVAANYRLSPKATFPEHLIDCKLALRWIREHIADYGGDPSFVAVTGGSAGGHLASLLALTPNDPAYQPGFEQIDTRVQAAVPFYGAYDFLHHNGVEIAAAARPGFVEKQVMKSSPRADPQHWRRASPILQVGPHAPPFFVLHGSHDSLLWPEGAREFVAVLRRASRQPVVYAELPGAQHAFDLLRSVRCEHAVNGVARFLAWVRSQPVAS